MNYTIYKTTNNINGKYYIGSHKTKDINDSYMGSGKYLNYAINKYGLENFTKEILFVFNNPEDMYNKEAELVTEEFLAEENTYNLKVGGFGGWDYVNSDEELRLKKNQKARATANANGALDNAKIALATLRKDKNWVANVSAKRVATLKERYGPDAMCLFKDKNHTQQTKDTIGAANSLHQKGKGNSQFGTRWITNGTINKKIKKGATIPDGFKQGRVYTSK